MPLVGGVAATALAEAVAPARHHLASFNVVSLGAPMLLSNVVCTIEELLLLLPGRFRQSLLCGARYSAAAAAATASYYLAIASVLHRQGQLA